MTTTLARLRDLVSVTWARRLVVTAVGVSGALMSAYYLPLLARIGDVPAGLAWTLFMVTEAFGVGGVLTWRAGRPEQRRWGLCTALGALALSVTFMVAAHLLDGRNPIGVAVIAVYPIALWLSIHLLIEDKRHVKARSAGPKASAPARRDIAPPPTAPKKPQPAADSGRKVGKHGPMDLVTSSDGVTYWAYPMPDDATAAHRKLLDDANRTNKSRARKAQTNGVHT